MIMGNGAEDPIPHVMSFLTLISFSEKDMSTQNPQYMVKKLVPHWKFFKQTSPEKYGSGPVGMLKNLWGEVTIRIMSSLGC